MRVRRVEKLVAGGLEHTIVGAPRWHPTRDRFPVGLLPVIVRVVRIGVAAVLRALFDRRGWTVAVYREQTVPFRYLEDLAREDHPSQDAALARASEITEAMRTGRTFGSP